MFPDKKYDHAGTYAGDYFGELSRAAAQINGQAVERAAAIVLAAVQADRTVYACGNGGSAAICNHLLCDFAKGMQSDTTLKPKVVSLSSPVELITAIANDISYDEVFAFQMKTAARPADVLITVSSSGNSENIVRAVQWARNNGVRTIAFTGFEGGRSAELAEVNVHVPSGNYGIVEDLHQAAMHIMAQYMRMQNMDAGLIGQRKF
ncbi:phosphoheptose isomerase [Rhizomicrobium palustre]|uniref:Phosphoheptose isomerase n=1 Tax=Rhizomicrobium palustre TaxID=189966 RepID=A0A846MU10_9PROT|nr:SIS domain-containing protein [Rhizomicrobium palustre]NIK86924.1 phosphoheptose isomerase [Rhizomicrobium palustre]